MKKNITNLEISLKDLKCKNKFRIYISILMIRRFIFVMVLLSCVSASALIVISVLTAIQSIYIILLILLRPYEDVKDNIIEIIYELTFLLLFSCLIGYNTQSEWNLSFAFVFVTIILGSSCINFLIIHGFLAKIVVIKIKNRKKNLTKVEPFHAPIENAESMEPVIELLRRQRDLTISHLNTRNTNNEEIKDQINTEDRKIENQHEDVDCN